MLHRINVAIRTVQECKQLSILPTKLTKLLRYLAHEMLGITRATKPGETFSTWSQKGGKKALFVKVSQKQKSSNISEEETNKVTKHNNYLMKKIGSVVCGETKHTAWKQVSTQYKRSKYTHIILSDSEQLNLRMDANMTGRSWLKFCTTLKRLKGVVLHNTASNSLSKLMAGKIPDFETGHVQVYESNKLVMRQYFIVENILESVREQIFSVMEDGIFTPSNVFTKLTNNSIIL